VVSAALEADRDARVGGIREVPFPNWSYLGAAGSFHQATVTQKTLAVSVIAKKQTAGGTRRDTRKEDPTEELFEERAGSQMSASDV
jgi:hypothetical protein